MQWRIFQAAWADKLSGPPEVQELTVDLRFRGGPRDFF